MSVVSRIISASLASWIRIVITIASQVAAVPIYLHYWDLETYGAWLLTQSLISFVTVADIAYQNYLGYEFLRLGRQNRAEVADVFCSAIPIAFAASFIIFAVLSVAVLTDVLSGWLGISTGLIHAFNTAVLITAATWVLTGSAGGVVGRVLYPFDYYPMLAWAGTAFALISAVVPATAVALGSNLIGATLALAVANILYNAVLMSAVLPKAKQEQLFSGTVDLKAGLIKYGTSLALAAQTGLELLRQHGSRLVLLPLVGMTEMAGFSTMRTGANFALQGLNTVTGPVMPELMRFLVARDQARTESAFAVVWLVLCAVLSPGVLVVQYIAPSLFPLWTHGKIIFDPILFGTLSLGVLIVALAQPAAAVVQGNNLLRPQFFISLLAGLLTVFGMYLLVPIVGVRGAALALLSAEIASLLTYMIVAFQWLRGNQMVWPTAASTMALFSVVVAALGMSAIALFPQSGLLYLGLGLTAETLVTIVYWRNLPAIARARAARMFSRFLPHSWGSRLSVKADS
jgi:O-antigen/teichoic acid export membrane protein